MSFKDIAGMALMITQIITCAVLLIKPLREWVVGMEDVREGQRCLLRSQIVRIYYHNVDKQTMKQYEYENMVACYRAYKKLGGNSFIDHIRDEMETWTIH